MTFVFTQDETFEWPVTIFSPKDGGHAEDILTGIFATQDDEQLLKRPDASEKLRSAGIETEIDQTMTYFKGWPDGAIKDAQGKDFPATPANIRAFLNRRPNRLAVVTAYNEAVTPLSGARAKN